MQRARGRNCSLDSQFDSNNIPPKEYLQNDPKFLDKPGRLDLTSIDTRKQPLAGRLSEIGQQILKLGSKKAGYICTGDWEDPLGYKKLAAKGFVETTGSFGPNKSKVTSFDPFNYSEEKQLKIKKQRSVNPELDRLN